MERGGTIPFRGGVARIVGREALQHCGGWPAAFQAHAKDHRFYELIEQTLDCGFEHHYLVLEDATGVVRGVQPVFLVRQNLVEAVPALRPATQAIRRVFPHFLTMRILMVGCAAGEGQLGVCAPGDEEWVASALHPTLATYARQCKASLVVLKDLPARYRTALRNLNANAWGRVASMPLTRLTLRYRDFDDYLNSLSKATRKDLRRKFRRAERAAPIELEVRHDVCAIVDELYPLYLQVHERSPMKFERLTKDCFRSLGRQMPDKVRFFVWRQNGRLVAFTLAFVHAGTFYDECLGLDYRVALDLHLYFYTLRDIIRWSLENKLECYCSSPLNYEPKLHLGCELMPLDLYVMHTSPLLNRLFRPVLKLLEPTRHEPVLRRFPNAHEL